MTNYVYPNNQARFGTRDGYGAQLDLEFDAVVVASASKLNVDNPSFTGTMTGGGVVDGGVY